MTHRSESFRGADNPGTAALEDMRVILSTRSPRAHARGTECRAYACSRTTSEGKPFCSYHLFSHPYAAAVHVALARAGELGPHERDVDETPVRRVHRARVRPSV